MKLTKDQFNLVLRKILDKVLPVAKAKFEKEEQELLNGFKKKVSPWLTKINELIKPFKCFNNYDIQVSPEEIIQKYFKWILNKDDVCSYSRISLTDCERWAIERMEEEYCKQHNIRLWYDNTISSAKIEVLKQSIKDDLLLSSLSSRDLNMLIESLVKKYSV